jgi:hypothetical protein
VDDLSARRVLDSYRDAACIVVCPTPFGRANLPNLQAALDSARPLVLLGEFGEDRDFTGGEARRLWDEALARGAERADSEYEALAIVKRYAAAEEA